MAEIIGVRFRKSGRIYHFDPVGTELKLGDNVVVETASGLGLGRAVVFTTTEAAGELAGPLKPVVRLATPEDIDRASHLCNKEKEALGETSRLVAKLALPMKLISAEYNLDSSHLTIFFSAEGRVDFRELVREISHNLKVRVELRQIGPRDETKLLGGFGRCGREHCCATFLDEFSPVSIKMAKVQDLPLNPMKISGVCGRLLCCLGYECEQYRAIKERMPREGQRVMTEAGLAVVVGHNTLEENVLVEYETGVRLEIPAAKATLMENRPVEPGPQPAPKPAAQAMAAEVRTIEISASASEVKLEAFAQPVNQTEEKVPGAEIPLATPENLPESPDETGSNIL
jgi:cell fate regulator YaaT (PSP1 superfamily)